MSEIENKEKNILRIDIPKNESHGQTLGWQVKFNKKENYPYTTKFFSDSVHGSKNEALKKAIEYRDYLINNEYKGYYDCGSRSVNGKIIVTSLPASNTSGILAVNRSIQTERGGNKYPVWQTQVRTENGKITSKSFRVSKYGEIPALLLTIKARKNSIIDSFNASENESELSKYLLIIEEYENIENLINTLSDNEKDIFTEYINNEKIEGKNKRSMLNRRVGQNTFRKNVLDYWNGQCAIIGASAFVLASHIKPWSLSSGEEKLDLYNGLALSPNHDRAFDLGYISFDKNGCIMIFPDFIEQAELLNIKENQKLSKYTHLHDKYMSYHRKYIYREKI